MILISINELGLVSVEFTVPYFLLVNGMVLMCGKSMTMLVEYV